MSDLAISARNLGSIAIPSYCPRCLAILLRLRFQPPFKFGGALFGDAERCQKAILGYYLEKDGCLPKQFSPFCDCGERIEYPRHWSKFRFMHSSGVTLYGIPDEIFRRNNKRGLSVLDLKSAHFKGDEDPFHNQYAIQLIGYSYIAEGLELGTVTMCGLLYWDLQVGEVQEKPSEHYSSERLWLPMVAKPLEVELDYKKLDPLIKELQKVAKSSTLPDGREGCKDCKKLDLLFAIDQELKTEDRIEVQRYADVPSVRREIVNRQFQRQGYLRDLLQEFRQKGEDIFAADGMAANWEFPSNCGYLGE